MTDRRSWHDRLREEGHTRRFTRGERLFLQGYKRGAVLVVHRGVLRIMASTFDGEEITLALAGPGQIIGSHSAVTGDPVGADVVAVEDGEGTIVPADRYLAILSETPESMLDEIRDLVSMLHSAEGRLVDIATQEVGVRVARQLERLCGDEPVPVHLPLTHTDLASMVGAARASVSPVLADLRARGAISTGRGEIVVLDRAALAAPSSPQHG